MDASYFSHFSDAARLYESYPYMNDEGECETDVFECDHTDDTTEDTSATNKAAYDPSYRGSRKTNRAAPQQVRDELVKAVRAKIDKGHYNSSEVISDLSESMAGVFNERR